MSAVLSYEHTERQRERLMQVNGDAWEWVLTPILERHNAFQWTLPLPLGVFIPLVRF